MKTGDTVTWKRNDATGKVLRVWTDQVTGTQMVEADWKRNGKTCSHGFLVSVPENDLVLTSAPRPGKKTP